MTRAAFVLALAAAGCGRIGFEARADDAAGSEVGSDAPASALAWVRPYNHVLNNPPTTTDTITLQAQAAGDALVLAALCTGGATRTLTVSAPGWTFTQLGKTGNTVISLGAIVPDTQPVTITLSWSGSSCGYFQEAADEFSGADTTAAFDAHAEATGTGNCNVSVTTGHADEAVWAACVVPNVVTAPGPGFTIGVDAGNPTEYKLTADAAGTVEAVSAINSAATDMYQVVAVTLKPR